MASPADQTGAFQESSGSQQSKSDLGMTMISDAATRVKEDVEQLVQGFDLQAIAKRVEEFGRENPIALALTALTVGVTAGFLLRAPKKMRGTSRPSPV